MLTCFKPSPTCQDLVLKSEDEGEMEHPALVDWQFRRRPDGDVETRTSLCLYFTSFTFHPTALLLSIHSELPISC